MSWVIRGDLATRPGAAAYAAPAGVAKLVRRARLKIGWPSGHAGSSPAPGTQPTWKVAILVVELVVHRDRHVHLEQLPLRRLRHGERQPGACRPRTSLAWGMALPPTDGSHVIVPLSSTAPARVTRKATVKCLPATALAGTVAGTPMTGFAAGAAVVAAGVVTVGRGREEICPAAAVRCVVARCDVVVGVHGVRADVEGEPGRGRVAEVGPAQRPRVDVAGAAVARAWPTAAPAASRCRPSGGRPTRASPGRRGSATARIPTRRRSRWRRPCPCPGTRRGASRRTRCR